MCQDIQHLGHHEIKKYKVQVTKHFNSQSEAQRPCSPRPMMQDTAQSARPRPLGCRLHCSPHSCKSVAFSTQSRRATSSTAFKSAGCGGLGLFAKKKTQEKKLQLCRRAATTLRTAKRTTRPRAIFHQRQARASRNYYSKCEPRTCESGVGALKLNFLPAGSNVVMGCLLPRLFRPFLCLITTGSACGTCSLACNIRPALCGHVVIPAHKPGKISRVKPGIKEHRPKRREQARTFDPPTALNLLLNNPQSLKRFHPKQSNRKLKQCTWNTSRISPKRAPQGAPSEARPALFQGLKSYCNTFRV